MEEIHDTHQYSARQLVDQWRNMSGGQPLQPVHNNDDYYAPYTPQIVNRNNPGAVPNSQAYYYDPRVDNPQQIVTPDTRSATSDSFGKSHVRGNTVTNDLLFAY